MQADLYGVCGDAEQSRGLLAGQLFELKQNQPMAQGERFSQIRYGSQVDLIIPLSSRWDFETIHPVGYHIEAGVDKLVTIKGRE